MNRMKKWEKSRHEKGETIQKNVGRNIINYIPIIIDSIKTTQK